MATVNPHPPPTNPERRAWWKRVLFSTFVVSVLAIGGPGCAEGEIPEASTAGLDRILLFLVLCAVMVVGYRIHHHASKQAELLEGIKDALQRLNRTSTKK